VSASRSESRGVPLLLFLKKAWVEYYPMGVIGIIVPWVHTYLYLYGYISVHLPTVDANLSKPPF
jgi:acyl-CoA reductase-like NAD-dependent aldehyde dehydrogenase